ncbi:flagellar hook-length control protein FliK [Halonatronum saccharophilum]|uniref:flagellar hook-length control protein FliK n=1 Tax=Halonatronum saccharophilum TaxID=150060 RepID=UPI0004886FD7|nr:flagellar hook-length control protein FliK [Halonatronum saccharophilum]
MIDTNNIRLLKQYNLETNKLSNLITENLETKEHKSLSNKDLLINLGLDSKNQNLQIIEEFLKADLPIKKDLIIKISKLIDQLEDLSNINIETKIKTSLLLNKLKLPLTPKFFNIFKDSLDLEKELTESLTNELNTEESFADISNYNIDSIKGQPSISSDLSFKLIEFLKDNNITELIEKIDQDPEQFLSNKEISKLLLPKLKELINQSEENLMQLKEKDLSVTKLLKLLSLEENIETTVIINDFKKELSKNIIRSDNLNWIKVSQIIEEINLKEGELIKSLFNLQIHQEEDKGNLNENSDRLTRQLIGVRANNLENDTLTLFLPFLIEQEINLIKIDIDKENIQGWKEGEKLNISFKVQTDKLGLIDADIQIKDKNFDLLFKSPQSDTLKLIKDNIALLKERLKLEGVMVAKVDYKLLQENLEENKEKINKVGSIDIKV